MEGKDIVQKALELGYESCGIINIAMMAGYAEKTAARAARFPSSRAMMDNLAAFSRPQENFPWAKSIVVCVRRYGKYAVSSHLQGLIGKYYLADGRKDARSPDYQASVAFENHLAQIGLKAAGKRDFGATALRWAAVQAGLGAIRENNFFYSKDSGSWVYLEAWLLDQELEVLAEDRQKPCPEGCGACRRACPTASLTEAYAMERASCVSCLTTWEGWDWPNDSYRHLTGGWVFGCDACQDACPFNAGKWSHDEEFPGLAELSAELSLEKIINMDYDFLRDVMQPKFWYINKENVWRWKTNALNAMLNNYNDRYRAAIEKAAADPDGRVRDMAVWVRESLDRL